LEKIQRFDKIYIPAAKKKTLEAEKVEPLAEDILENGLLKPIYVRLGKDRYVLQEGLHRVQISHKKTLLESRAI